MSNKPKAKTNITKITANSAPKAETETKPEKVEKAAAPIAKTTQKPAKNTEEKPLKEVFILARPFVAFGRYLRDSWREIRQVRWPNRKATWKMTLAVLVYVALFMIFLTLIDMLFTFIFDLLFKQ